MFRIALAVLFALTASVGAQPFRQKLTSVADNLHVPTFEVSGKSVTPACPVPWSIRRVVLHGGRQEGSELIVVDNGMLKLTLIPTRGMGVLSAQLGDVPGLIARLGTAEHGLAGDARHVGALAADPQRFDQRHRNPFVRHTAGHPLAR